MPRKNFHFNVEMVSKKILNRKKPHIHSEKKMLQKI